jgi:hypothetical protein
MNGNEHREIGDAAAGGAAVNLGGASAQEQFWLGYGDVMALSGDYFLPDPSLSPGTLFALARTPGDDGGRPGTRDEIVCALKIMTIDERFVDPRFEPGGRFAGFTFAGPSKPSDVERRVRDRYLELAATNDDHFVVPGGITHAPGEAGGPPFGSAALAYRRYHEATLELACGLGRDRGDLSQAMAREAAAQHFLTDAFTAGHLRTPVARIRRFWRARYPSFWDSLQRRVAADTAARLAELSWALRRLPARSLHDLTLAGVRRRTGRYPPLSLGDFLARLFHDWDNSHGLAVDCGGVVFGDGHVQHGETRELALAAVRAGIDDVEAAFELGASRGRLTGEPLYRAVRAATGARDGVFLAEAMIPRPSAANPPQNWRASNIERLWETPIVGAAGTAVGEALADMMRPDGYFIRQLDCLGQGLVEAYGLLAVPVLGNRLAHKACQAYQRGFVEPLAAQPRRVILSLLGADAEDEPPAVVRAERTPAGPPQARPDTGARW